jgi:stage II sporulation protein D
VATLRVVTDDGTFDVHGDSTRRVLRPAPDRILNSARFELDGRVQDGQVVALTVEGGGWGHGVGMCQMGAVGRARAGQSYRDILRHYYSGTDIIRLY